MPSKEYHPVASIFRMMRSDELQSLADDIATNGLREPIWLHPNGQIIDGRNRYEACEIAGVCPEFQAYTGTDAELPDFVWSLNAERRHLTPNEKAMAASRMAKLKEGRPSVTAQNCAISQQDAADKFGISRRSVQSARTVQDKGSPELVAAVESGKASVSAAAQVATLPKEEQAEVVARGEKDIIAKAKEIQKKKRETKRAERVAKIAELSKGNEPLGVLGDQRFPVILADPPWRYSFSVDSSDDIENHYPTMALEDIKALPVRDLSTDDGILFLWTTSPKLPEGIEVMEAWGYDYKTCAIWHKSGLGMGYYFRQNHELLLVGTKGSLPAPLPANRPPSVIAASKSAHSAKPEKVHRIIEAMYPDLPRLEMFCRSSVPGWSAWGNEASQ